MRYLFFCFVLPLGLFPTFVNSVNAGSQWSSSRNPHLSSRADASFYTAASRVVQQQINLLARIEMALVEPDPNYMRVVRGRLLLQTKAVERFLKNGYTHHKPVCDGKARILHGNPLPPSQKTNSQVQIYCSLLASNRELLKLTPDIDRLLARRGELGWVRDLPLVSGERRSHPVLSIAPIKRPNLGDAAVPFSLKSSDTANVQMGIRGNKKTAIANYITPVAPAIAPPPEVLKILQSAQTALKLAKAAFPVGIKFTNPRENQALIDRSVFSTNVQEEKMYAQFLAKPNRGIFRVLPVAKANGSRNRLQPGVRERYPFPSLVSKNNGFTPNLGLEIVDEQFTMLNRGVDYSLMVDVGDIPMEKLDNYLQKVNHLQKDLLFSYQPPKQLEKLQIDRRRFLTGKQQNWHQEQPILAQLPAKLNHTYLVRLLQFQLPEIIRSGEPVALNQRLYIDQLLAMESSDVIVAFRPVRRRADGSYTILWRVVKRLPDPQIKDLEDYLQLSHK